jgi:predicted HTH transcriptional regulator
MLEEILATLKKWQGKPLKPVVADTVNDTVTLLKANPHLTLDELALQLNTSRSTIARIIRKLRDEGAIVRVGSDKAGFWRLNCILKEIK